MNHRSFSLGMNKDELLQKIEILNKRDERMITGQGKFIEPNFAKTKRSSDFLKMFKKNFPKIKNVKSVTDLIQNESFPYMIDKIYELQKTSIVDHKTDFGSKIIIFTSLK